MAVPLPIRQSAGIDEGVVAKLDKATIVARRGTGVGPEKEGRIEVHQIRELAGDEGGTHGHGTANH